jgi:hypothetical protein
MQQQQKGGTPKPPDPIPPVTQASTEVAQASLQAKRDAAKRNGYASTLLAGETGGNKDAPKTLLGA